MSNQIAVSISIAMCTYNGAKYLREQLDSLATQTCLPFELVICDDGSADATQQIIQEYAQTAPFPVRFIKNEINLGYAENFLKAAKLCHGKWIAFCDQDDYWMKNKLARIKKEIISHSGKDLVYIAHTALIATENLKIVRKREPDFLADKLINRGKKFGFTGYVGFSVVFDAKLIKDFDSNLRPKLYYANYGVPGHDHWIGLLANVIGSSLHISEPLAIWRRHEYSVSGTPCQDSIYKQALISSKALDPAPYIFCANMAEETSKCLKALSDVNSDHRNALRLKTGAYWFSLISETYMLRARLYGASSIKEKISAFLSILRLHGYFGPTVRALGWRAFLKDAAFAFGVIG